jgi:hypothetical protein
MYITTTTFDNQMAEPVLAAEVESTYMQIYEKRFELGLVDGQGFTFLAKIDPDGIYIAREPWTSIITADTVAERNVRKAADAVDFARTADYQVQRRAWNTQQAAQAFADFVNQLNSPVWSATYDGLDESVQIQG